MTASVVLVVDFGAQYAQLIARRVREAGVFSEIVHHDITAEEVAAKNPAAIILSGGPASVYEPGSPKLDAKMSSVRTPVDAMLTVMVLVGTLAPFRFSQTRSVTASVVVL